MRSAVASPSPDLGAGCANDLGRGGTVRIAALKKTYGELEAIREVSFEVGDGEFLSVLGPSGCGKSTLLMMIAGLIPPTAGEIRVKDAKVTGPRREVGVVFQSPVLLPWRTVLQNVLFPIELLRLPRPTTRRARWNCCAWRKSRNSPRCCRVSSRAACGSASRFAGRSCTIPASC